MTLQEAIKILGDYKMQSAFDATPAFTDALKLGIEAMKVRIAQRAIGYLPLNDLLPGETKE